MNIEPPPRANLIDGLRDMNTGLPPEVGKHDRVTVLIQACIGQGTQLVSVIKELQRSNGPA